MKIFFLFLIGTPPLDMIASPDPFAWVVSRLNYQISKQIHKQSQFSQYISRILLSPLYCGILLCKAGASTQYAVIHTSSTDEKNDLGRGNQYRYSSTTLGSTSGKESSVHTNASNNPSSHKFIGMNPNAINSTGNSGKKEKKRKKKKYEDIILSTGCSAFIRVIDPRVKRLAGPPVSFLHNYSGNNNANNNIPSTPYGNGNGGNGMLSVPGSPGPTSALNQSPNQFPSGGANANGYVSIHNNTGIRTYQQDTLHDVLYLMSHFAYESAEGTFSLQFDGKKYKQLRHDFSLQPHLYQQYNNARSKALVSMLLRGGRGGQGRSFLNAIPDSIEKEALIQEINNKFYDVLSS